MNTEEENLEKDEIVNPEQFQVGRAPEEKKETEREDADYTPEEVEFADGQGTQLDEEIDAPDSEEIDLELDDDDEFDESDEV